MRPPVCLRDRYGDWGRDLVLWAARRYGGLTLREVGARAGQMDCSAVALAVLRLKAQSQRDRVLRQAMTSIHQKCTM